MLLGLSVNAISNSFLYFSFKYSSTISVTSSSSLVITFILDVSAFASTERRHILRQYNYLYICLICGFLCFLCRRNSAWRINQNGVAYFCEQIWRHTFVWIDIREKLGVWLNYFFLRNYLSKLSSFCIYSSVHAACKFTGRLFFFLEDMGTVITVGLYLFPVSFCITRTGRIPSCSEPIIGLRSA